MSSVGTGGSNFEPEKSRLDRLLFSGGLGISVVAVFQLMSMSELDWVLSFSLHCFALAIPLLSVGVVLMDVELERKNHVRNYVLVLGSGLVGLVATVLGLVGVFVHLGDVGKFVFHKWEVAAIFVIAVVIAYLVGKFSY
jgi:hypothetical protein